MDNVSRAEQAVRNAQDQLDAATFGAAEADYLLRLSKESLDQALKELEKARKPKVWEKECLLGVDIVRTLNEVTEETQPFDYPCKVTVRPLGGPEPVVIDLPPFATVSPVRPLDGLGIYNGTTKKLRLTLEEVE